MCVETNRRVGGKKCLCLQYFTIHDSALINSNIAIFDALNGPCLLLQAFWKTFCFSLQHHQLFSFYM